MKKQIASKSRIPNAVLVSYDFDVKTKKAREVVAVADYYWGGLDCDCTVDCNHHLPEVLTSLVWVMLPTGYAASGHCCCNLDCEWSWPDHLCFIGICGRTEFLTSVEPLCLFVRSAGMKH